MSRENGGIFGKPVSPDAVTATGFWSLNAIQREKIATTWPSDLNIIPALKLDFNETTTLDNRISFTRATNGTYFNSSGVLTTAGSGVARFDHRLENGTWVNKGLLIEEQRTNLALRSEEIASSPWSGSNVTRTNNTGETTAPDGLNTSTKVVSTGSSSSFFQGISLTTTVYSGSIWLKTSGGNITAEFIVYLSVSPFTVIGNSGVITITPEWQRFTLTTSTATNTTYNFQLNNIGAGTVYAWGAQLEVGAFPTSYIKTTSASATRNADVASMTSTNFSSWYNATEGTTFWQGDTANAIALTNVALRGYEISDGTVNERIGFNLGFEGNTRTFFGIDGGAGQWNIFSPDPAVALVANQTYKAASAYKLNDFAHSLNGNSPETDTSGTLPTVNKINLGADRSEANLVNGHIAKFYYWNTRLSNNFLRDYTKT